MVCPLSGAILASRFCELVPHVNDLAALLAHAMRRPALGDPGRLTRALYIAKHRESAYDERIMPDGITDAGLNVDR